MRVKHRHGSACGSPRIQNRRRLLASKDLHFGLLPDRGTLSLVPVELTGCLKYEVLSASSEPVTVSGGPRNSLDALKVQGCRLVPFIPGTRGNIPILSDVGLIAMLLARILHPALTVLWLDKPETPSRIRSVEAAATERTHGALTNV